MYKIPPPLNEPTQLQKVIDNEKDKRLSDDSRERSNSFLVRNVVEPVIKEDDSPLSAPVFQPESSYPFTPFTPSYYPQFTSFTPQQIYTNALDMAKDQGGCRLLQQKLDEGNTFALQAILEQVFPQLPKLMPHPFGNYLCQKLFEVLDKNSLLSVIDQVSPFLAEMALDTHGTRSVQKLISVAKVYPDLIYRLLPSIEKDSITLINDLNGNHVIQRCLQELGAPYDQFVYETAGKHLVEIATHKHGCCVLQRCIDAATHGQREALVDKIIENAVRLVQDAFGNYVVQYVIDLENPENNARLALIFIGHMEELATQKFSSNVIEKCLQKNSEDMQHEMIKAIGSPAYVAKLVVDQYANYVVQRALSLADPATRSKILKEIKVKSEEVKRSQFGSRIYIKLSKQYPEMNKKRITN